MTLNTRVGATSRNAALDAQTAQLNSGKFRIYDSAQPTDPDTALGAQVLLADLTLNSTAAPGSSGGIATFNAITDDSSADATGTAAWMSLLTSGAARRIDGSAGTATTNLVLNTVSIVIAARVQVTSCTLTFPMQGA